MKIISRISVGIFCLAAIFSYSQGNLIPKQEKKTSEAVKTPSGKEGLRKISQPKALDIEVDIDEVEIENSIKIEVDRAVRTVENIMENMEIHIAPIEIEFPEINIDTDHFIDLADIDIDIDPIDIEDIDIEIDIDSDFEFDNDWDEGEEEDSFRSEGLIKLSGKGEHEKIKEKLKDKSDKEQKVKTKVKDKEDKDKSKGLKKIE
jgi:hypothetical protein